MTGSLPLTHPFAQLVGDRSCPAPRDGPFLRRLLRPQHTGGMSNAWQDLRILTGNDWCSVRGDPSCVQLRRGAALSDPGAIPLWKRWQDAALARIAVAHEQIRQSVVFCGESALAIHGVPQWISNPDVEFTSGRAYTASWFPRVDIGDQCVPRVRVRRVTRKHPLRGVVNVRGLPVEDLWTTSVLIAAMRPPLEAFVAVSMALRRLSRFDRRDLAGSRAREEEVCRILLGLVAQGEAAGAGGHHSDVRAFRYCAIYHAHVEDNPAVVIVVAIKDQGAGWYGWPIAPLRGHTLSLHRQW